MHTKDIELVNITKKFGHHQILHNISFDAKKGDVIGLLGPNGAGKTTTIKILTTFMPPTSGNASIAGYDIYEDSENLRQNIGYLPDTPPLYDDMLTGEFLCFVAALKKVPEKQKQSQRDYVINKCGLQDVISRPIYKLSRGYRQRIGLAQAIINAPKVLILDEPTVGLDPKQIIEIRNLIRELATEHTILLSTHILSEVELLCNKVVIMNKGKIVAQDAWKNLTHEGQETVQVEIIVNTVSSSLFEELQQVSGVIDLEVKDLNRFVVTMTKEAGLREKVAHSVVESGAGLISYTTVRYRLEDLFLQLTKEQQDG